MNETDTIEEILGEFLSGTDVLGAGLPQSAPGPFVTIHVNNLSEVVSKKGGALGSFAFGLLPGTIESKAYGDMAAQFKEKLTEQGVNADVKVVSMLPGGGPMRKDFLVGGAVGAGSVGIVYGIVQLVRHLMGSRK